MRPWTALGAGQGMVDVLPVTGSREPPRAIRLRTGEGSSASSGKVLGIRASSLDQRRRGAPIISGRPYVRTPAQNHREGYLIMR